MDNVTPSHLTINSPTVDVTYKVPSLVNEGMVCAWSEFVWGHMAKPDECLICLRQIWGAKGEYARNDWNSWKDPEVLYGKICDFVKRSEGDIRHAFAVPGLLRAGSTHAHRHNIMAVGTICLDIDRGDIEANRQKAVEWMGEPGMELFSGGVTAEGQRKRHLWWRLPIERHHDLNWISALRRDLAVSCGGDTSFERSTQIIRIGGSVHLKGTPRLVEMIHVRR